MDNAARVTAIVPTLARSDRATSLLRAIRSLGSSSQAPVLILVVVNGDRSAPSVLAEIKSLPNVAVIQIAEASLPAALLAGRNHVTTEFFCFLDDDDEYLPGAIDTRLAFLNSRPEYDIVVTNGFRESEGTSEVIPQNLQSVSSDPIAALLQQNWLTSCGALYRSKSITPTYFENPLPYLEWTWLAFRMAIDGLCIGTIDAPTFRVNDTPGSLSKGPGYLRAPTQLADRMLRYSLPPRIRATVKKRHAAAWHTVADHHLHAGDLQSAWASHANSLRYLPGLRYTPFTWRLAAAGLLWRHRAGND